MKYNLRNARRLVYPNNIEYNKVKQAIEGEVENVLANHSQLLRIAIQSVIELLRLDPQKFHTFYYNRSTVQPGNNEEPLLVEAGLVYEKMLENVTNRIVTSLSDVTSSMSVFAQKGLCEEQAFHPNFDRIENNTNNTTNNQVS